MIVEGTPPTRFALEHGHYNDDIGFWTALANERGDPVLDLGAAVGRVTLPLARAGHTVTAVDGSHAMLDELRAALDREAEPVRARVTTVCCDFRALDVPGGPYRLAIMPMNSLQVLHDPDEHHACLAGLRRHLDVGGNFAFDVAHLDLHAVERVLGETHADVAWTDPASGAVLTHEAWYEEVDHATSTVRFTTRVTERHPDGSFDEHLRPHTVHIFAPTELWELVHGAGFAVQAVYGDFDGTPLSEGAPRQIYRCVAMA